MPNVASPFRLLLGQRMGENPQCCAFCQLAFDFHSLEALAFSS